MSNITIELTNDSSSAVKNVVFPYQNVAIIGCSCSSTNECSSYRVEFPIGIYSIDCFGASAINESKGYSLGGHTFGTISLNKKTIFYLYIGQEGTFNGSKTYGGGGKGNRYSWSGGGATDVRYIDDEEFEGLKSRIMVAGGGGGYSIYFNPPNNGGKSNGGGLNGEDGFVVLGNSGLKLETTMAKGGTQNSGGDGGISPESNDPNYDLSEERNGTFGKGGSTYYGSGGGGGGYFGGGAGKTYADQVGSGAGGSSYISGYKGCYSISETSTKDNIEMKNDPNHYSGYSFINSRMSDFSSSDLNYGNGYIIITFLSLIHMTCKQKPIRMNSFLIYIFCLIKT